MASQGVSRSTQLVVLLAGSASLNLAIIAAFKKLHLISNSVAILTLACVTAATLSATFVLSNRTRFFPNSVPLQIATSVLVTILLVSIWVVVSFVLVLLLFPTAASL